MSIRRTSATGTVLALVVTGLLVYAADVFKDLGITEAEAKSGLLGSVTTGYVPAYSAAKAVKAAAPGVRVTLVKGILAYVKTYAESPEFSQAYLTKREAEKPGAPTLKSGDAEWSKVIKDMEKAIEDFKKAVADPAQAPEMRKMFEQMAQNQTHQLASMKANPQMKTVIMQSAEAENAASKTQHATDLKEWEETFPANPKVALAGRLRKFLEVSATVDYGAQVQTVGATRRFVDPKYERQSSEWKLCYRTGKEAVDAARAFVTEWLAQLPK
jgi:hypothetical protein